MLSSHNSRIHCISEDAYDEAAMIDYIGSYTSNNTYPLFASSSSSSSSPNNAHHQSPVLPLSSVHSTACSDGKMFNDLLSPSTGSVSVNVNGVNHRSNIGHPSTTSPLSSLGESSQSNSPVNNNNVYDADDSGLDTTTMSCATTDGYFFNSQPTDRPQMMAIGTAQLLPSQIHQPVNHSNALSHPEVRDSGNRNTLLGNSRQLRPTDNHHRTQQHLSHHNTTGEQIGPFFNALSDPLNRNVTLQSDCSNVTSDTRSLTGYTSLTSDTMSMNSSRSRGAINSSVGGRSIPDESTVTDETSTLLEFPITYNTIESSGPSSNAINCSSGIQLKIITEPARHHRARYRTEGSRGAIKDRTGRSFPVIKLIGYNAEPVKLRCYIGHDRRHGEPHLYYQVSRIIGKNITPCSVIKTGGVKMIEIDLTPDNDMTAVINCIGIVKERNFDVQRRCIVTGCNDNSARSSVPSNKVNVACCGSRGSYLKRKQPSTPSLSSGRVNGSQVCNRSNYLTSKCTSSTSSVKSAIVASNSQCETVAGKSASCYTASINEVSSQSMVKATGASRYQAERRSTTCTLVFTCAVYANGTSSNLIAVSGVINCAQILGAPEIHKVSQTRDRSTGGAEVFVIGKNFTRDCKVVWDICPSQVKNQFNSPVDAKFWWRESEPESDYINQNHLVFKVPPLKTLVNETPDDDGPQSDIAGQPSEDQEAYVEEYLFSSPQVQVTFRIKCGEKMSEPHLFTFVSSGFEGDCENHFYRSSSF